jgi:hypothetical protein
MTEQLTKRDIFIWTMGKVGTGSYVHAFKEAKIKYWDAHWLKGKYPEAEFPLTSSRKEKLVKKFIEEKPDTIIFSGVREPVSRAISAYMYSWKRLGSVQTFDEMYKQLTEEFDVTYPDKWFAHVKSIIGFDAFNREFSHEQGYRIYPHEGLLDIVIIRLEDANQAFPAATERLLKKRIEMPKKNTWEEFLKDDPILPHYLKLKEAELPQKFIDKCYNTKYAQHFYQGN